MRRRRAGIAVVAVFLIGVVLFRPAALRHARLLAQGQAVPLGVHERPVGPASSSRASGTRWWWASSRSSRSLALIVPTAYWVQLRVPRARSFVEFVTLLPFVIPAGRPRLRPDPGLQPAAAPAHPHRPRQHVPARRRLRRPLAAVHVPGRRLGPARHRHPQPDRGRPEHGRRLVHDHRPDHPAQPSRGAPRGAFLTLAIVLGEFTIASFLARPAFGPYLPPRRVRGVPAGRGRLISFGLTWLAMIAIAFIGRDTRTRIEIGGAH